MIDYMIGIPSYRRADNQRTLTYLENLGFPKGRIIVSLQCPKDYDNYRKAGVEERVGSLVFKKGNNVSDNMNTLLNSVDIGTKLIMLDDDVNFIQKLENEKLINIESLEELNSLVEMGYSLVGQKDTALWGLYPVANSFFMKEGVKERALIIGSFFAVITSELRFNNLYSTKQDFEYCCQVIRKYGKLVRLENYTVKAQHYSKGGCADNWKDKETVINTAKKLCEEYSDIVRLNPNKEGEVQIAPIKNDKEEQIKLF